jgi:NADP-dependent 3-hydroxy acid dehydrogenase YdfG
MSKKIILITGATAGIGRHTAIHLKTRGHRVIATGRNEKALAELRQNFEIETVLLDVTRSESITAAKREVDRITNGYGIDVLVNNAGYGLLGPVEVLSEEDIRQQFETNVFGLIAVTRAFIPEMRARGDGRVINVSSVGGRMVFPLGGVYHATKYAVEALSDALRMELRQFGIRVSVIEPGYIKTEFTSTTMNFVRKYAETESPYSHTLAAAAQRDPTALERYAVGPQPVARAIEHASVARWSRARYVAPFYNALGPILMQVLPSWLTDWALRRMTGLHLPANTRTLPKSETPRLTATT